jgi:hypothetical protein
LRAGQRIVAAGVIGIVNYEVITRGSSTTERKMFERVAKLVKTDRARSWRLDQLARSIFLTEFVSAFFLAMRYFFKPRVTLNYRGMAT